MVLLGGELDIHLTFPYVVLTGGWSDGLSGESEDGLAKYLQMAESSSCRTYQWMQVRELSLQFSCFMVTCLSKIPRRFVLEYSAPYLKV